MDELMAEGRNKTSGKTRVGGADGRKAKWILTYLAVCADSMSAYCISAWKEPETEKR